MRSPSPALLHKIAMTRSNAPDDLPLVRDCSRVVLAWMSGETELEAAVTHLKNSHGSTWSLTSALQLLSGRRGQFAADCGDAEERAMLFFAHLLAKSTCCQAGLGSVVMPTQAELDHFRGLAARRAAATPASP